MAPARRTDDKETADWWTVLRDQGAKIDVHVAQCELKWSHILEKLDGLKNDHVLLRKMVIWIGGVILGVEVLGGHAMVRTLAKHYGIELP